MRVALFHDEKYQFDSTEKILTALKNHPRIESVVELRHESMLISTSSDNVTFRFGDVVFDPKAVDLLIFRGGHSEIQASLLFVKYCLKHGVKLFDNNLHRARYLINKKIDAVNFALAELPAPQSRFYTSLSQLKATDLHYPLVLKTIYTGQGKNVKLAHSFEEAEQFLKEIDKDIHRFVFQEYIAYEKDIRLVVLGNEVIASMQRIPHEGEFRANFSLGGDVIVFDAPEEMKNLAVKAARACDLEYGGIDILVDKSGKNYVLEANRTPGMVGISKALNIDIAEIFVKYVISRYD